MKHFTFAVCVLLLFASAEPATAQFPKDPRADALKRYGENPFKQIGSEKDTDNKAPWLSVRSTSTQVLVFARGKLGKLVGNGQCTALVEEALKAVGAKYPGNYVWGQAIDLGKVVPGDILQFKGVQFVGPNYRSSYDHHTAIVERVNGDVLTLIHQNVNTRDPNQKPVVLDSRVLAGNINLAHKTQGTIQAYRPMR